MIYIWDEVTTVIIICIWDDNMSTVIINTYLGWCDYDNNYYVFGIMWQLW